LEGIEPIIKKLESERLLVKTIREMKEAQTIIDQLHREVAALPAPAIPKV
jgi:hypothetical protein